MRKHLIRSSKKPSKPPAQSVQVCAGLLLLSLLAPCAAATDEDAERQYQQARQTLESGQTAQAALLFERLLLEQPWRLGVWLDYARALQAMGDTRSARAIYQSLLQQNPPEHLVPWLREQAQVPTPLITDWQTSGAITLQTGHDSNLNRATSASNLTLTLPGAPTVFSLSDASRANAGPSRFMRFDWQAGRHTAGGDWLVQLALNSRLAPGASDQNYQQSSIGVMHGWSGEYANEYHAIVSAQNLNYGGKDIQRTLRGGFYQKHYWQSAAQTDCTIRYGAEAELLAYPASSELDGRYLGVAVDLGCKQKLDWQLLLRIGNDQPESKRPGGAQQRVSLRGQTGGNLGAGQWLALAELTRSRDESGYSPLLENNAARQIQNQLLKFEYQYPVVSKLHALATAEIFQQTSNLPLFALRGRAGWLGLRYSF